MDIIKYKVIITPTAYREMDRIYEYIAEVLFAKDAAKRLMQQVEEKIRNITEDLWRSREIWWVKEKI